LSSPGAMHTMLPTACSLPPSTAMTSLSAEYTSRCLLSVLSPSNRGDVTEMAQWEPLGSDSFRVLETSRKSFSLEVPFMFLIMAHEGRQYISRPFFCLFISIHKQVYTINKFIKNIKPPSPSTQRPPPS
jgi:hypothetical protein